MGRNLSSLKPKLTKGLWSPEEDEKLYSHITRFGVGCWSSVPKLAGLQRCGKSCRLRWINYLRPDLKRGMFSQQEEDLILSLHEHLGNRWAQIAVQLPGRTDNEIKNFWNSCLKKKLMKQGIDPNTHKPALENEGKNHEKIRVEKESSRGPEIKGLQTSSFVAKKREPKFLISDSCYYNNCGLGVLKQTDDQLFDPVFEFQPGMDFATGYDSNPIMNYQYHDQKLFESNSNNGFVSSLPNLTHFDFSENSSSGFGYSLMNEAKESSSNGYSIQNAAENFSWGSNHDQNKLEDSLFDHQFQVNNGVKSEEIQLSSWQDHDLTEVDFDVFHYL